MNPIMKKDIFKTLLITLVLLPAMVFSQATKQATKRPVKKQEQTLDRSIKPLPGPAPVINIGKYESFTLDNGLKVFVVENHKIPRVSYSLLIDYVPVAEGESAGLADITGQMLRTGTSNLTKDQLDEEIGFIGASLFTSSTGLYASGLKKHNDKLLQLMSDVMLNPSFNADELEKVRTRSLSALESEKDEPSAISERVSKKLLYGVNHPYSESMTEKSVKSLTADQCKTFYQTFFKPQISYMAIVGDITLTEAKANMEKYFSGWQKVEVPNIQLQDPKLPASNVVAIVDRPDAVQTTLNIGYPVDLKPGSPDAIKARVTNTILGGGTFRLFNNLREDKAYTYGAYSRLKSDKYAGSFSANTEIRNSVTDSAVDQILYEMKRIRKELVPADELSLAKNYMAGNFALSLEDPQTVANFAINTSRYELPADYYVNYLKNLAAVSAEDVMAMSDKYILPDNNYIVAVGKASDISSKLQAFAGKSAIRYFDVEGNEYDPAKKVKPAPEGMTAADVINAYVNAIGGAKALNKIKDVTINATTSMQGMTIGFDIYKKAPDKYMMKIGAGDMVFQKMAYDGTNAVVFSPMNGESKKLEGDELADMKLEAVMNPELIYDQLGIKLQLDGIETVNDVDAYKVILTKSSGKQTTRYFDTKTSLLIREVNEGGISEYGDYREVNKVMFPFLLKQSMGGQNLDLNVLTVKVNQKLKDDLFIIK